jgi:hypothetical protein
MKTLGFFIIAAGLALGCSAQAKDGLSPGGAAWLPMAMSGEANQTPLTQWGALSAGVSSGGSTASSGVPHSGLQTGGFLAWNAGTWRIDAGLRPSLDGGVSTDLGFGFGAAPGELGTRYGLRLGGAWGGSEHFSPNLMSGYGLTLPNTGGNNNGMGLTLRLDQAITPNLSFVGTAETRYAPSSATDGAVSQTQLLLGARLGLRF